MVWGRMQGAALKLLDDLHLGVHRGYGDVTVATLESPIKGVV
jgi:hypothetical protein